MAVYLPLALLGVGAWALEKRRIPDLPVAENESMEDVIVREYKETAEQVGMSANFYSNNLQNYQGAWTGYLPYFPLVYHEGGGYQPNSNIDPVEKIRQNNADLIALSMRVGALSVHTQQPRVVPERRMPIITSLTPTLENPNVPGTSVVFQDAGHRVSNPNEQQVKDSKFYIANASEADKILRLPQGHEWFRRAPGQSFRYE